jgi:hypothetical protein
LTSVLNSSIAKSILGAGAGALAGKIFGGGTKPTGGGKQPSGGTSGGGTKPTGGGAIPTTGGTTGGITPNTGGNSGYQYPINPNGGTPYDDEGNLMPGWQLDEENNPVWVGSGEDTTVAGGGSDDENTVVAGGDDEDETVVAEGDDEDETVVAEDDSGDNFFVADSGDYFDGGDFFDGGDAFAKNGGSMHQKRKGGLPRFADGNLVDETGMISDFAINEETGDLYKPLGTNESGDSYIPVLGNQGYVKNSTPTALSDLVKGDSTSNPRVTNVDLAGGTNFTPTPGIQYFDDGSYIQTFDDGSTITVDSDGNLAGVTDAYTTTGGDEFTPVPSRQYFDDGSYIQTFDDGSTITVDSDGNIAGATDGYQTTVDDNGNTTVTDGYGNRIVYDPNGNVIPMGGGREAIGAITSGGGNAVPSYVAQQAKQEQKNQQPQKDQSGILDALKGYITQNPGLAGGAIGALLASLMNSSGESAGPSQPVDISALTAIAPRTTDFGPGMTGGRTGTGSSIVPYQDYDQGFDYAYTPDERLYSDLGISGYLNEPDMTDYTDEAENAVDQYGNALNDTETTEEPAMASGGATTHYTFGRAIDPAESLGLAQGMKKGGLSQAHTTHSHHTNPVINNRIDFRQGSAVNGAGDGQSDDIPAWLADGEYVMDAELVSMLGNGSNKAGAKVLDKFREEIRAHKRSAPLGKIPPKAKSPLNYLKESMNG